jgi:predicted SAM-dependent methyltransferase
MSELPRGSSDPAAGSGPRHLDLAPNFGRRVAGAKGWKRWGLKLLPFHVWQQIRFELAIARARWRHRGTSRRFRAASNLLVNVGCGSAGHPGWVNVDVVPSPGVNCVCDCRRHLPFADGAAAAIFTEHFLEHLDYTEEAPYFLAECRRVLAAGGVLRVVVPDAGRYLQAYAEPGWDALQGLRGLGAGQADPYTGSRYGTKMELINEVFRQSGEHKFAYDEETLMRLLRFVGFSRVVRQSSGSSLDPRLLIDLPSRQHESLYLEAQK